MSSHLSGVTNAMLTLRTAFMPAFLHHDTAGLDCHEQSSGLVTAIYADKTLHTAFTLAFSCQDTVCHIGASIAASECAYPVWHAGTDLILSI